MFLENSIFALQIFEKQVHVFVWPTLPISRQKLSYMWIFTWEKDIAKEEYITQLNKALFINITKDLQYYIVPRYAWNAVFL